MMGNPTDAMIDFAAAIADALGLDAPDYEDYDEVADFIYLNKEEYYRQRS